ALARLEGHAHDVPLRRGRLQEPRRLARRSGARARPGGAHLRASGARVAGAEIAATLRALLGSRYPHANLHVVVATREEEEHTPHPTMGVSTAELVRRFREGLPPWQQKMLSLVTMPGEGRKAHQLNWALRPEVLKPLLDLRYDPARVFIGLSDADSIPDTNIYRWIAADLAKHRGQLAYQGVTLSLANFARLDVRGRVCAVQQSSIFIRVSIARLINERRRIAAFARL